ncbi:MAG: type II secretion system secretin GspD [Sedimentisphaerales bacterium]|nr:type II secretion system secretin GspD [Sedimentisphaerales bacterium]
MIKCLILIVCLAALLHAGCQSQPQSATAPDHKDLTVYTPENSQTRIIDEETARILKRHSVEYKDWRSQTSESSDETMTPDDTLMPDTNPQITDENLNGPKITQATDTPVFTENIVSSALAQPDESSLRQDQDTPDRLFQDVTTAVPALSDPQTADQLISVNFDQADIRSVIKTISEITGINFIVDESIKGTVTVLSPTELRLGEIYHFLESILTVKGFAAVPAGDHVKIVPRTEVNKHNLRIRIGCNPADIPQDDSIVTQIMPLKYANVDEISRIINSRLSAGANLATYESTNTLLLTDTSANIYHIAKIIFQLDVPGSKEELTVIPLQYASAQMLARQITDILENEESSTLRSRRTGQQMKISSKLQIQPNERTNSLIVIANQDDTRLIRDLVRQLDVERPTGAYDVHVVPLKNAQAESIAKSLSQALANRKAFDESGNQLPIQITPDPGTNALIIHASSQDFKVISDIIEKLDIAREMVLVELLIIEISEENLREIGVDWATLDQAVSDSIRVFGNTNFGVRVDYINGDTSGLSVGAFKDIGGDVKIGSILNALENVSGVNILSTPHILTSNHSEANILVGDNIPYVVQSKITETDPATPTVIKTVDYKDVGVSLKITPHISQSGIVRLAIYSEFTKLIESVTGLSSDTPTTAKRQIETEIAMADGATVVIGGLIRDDKITIENKIPLLGDLPLIGGLFKLQRDRLQKTNLLLFITPYVLKDQPDMARITQKKREEIAPELGQRTKDENLENIDILESIWR